MACTFESKGSLNFCFRSAYHQPTSYRPRLLLSGERDSGQTSHLAPAVLHCLEKFAVHRLDLPALYSVSAKTPEESCAQVSLHLYRLDFYGQHIALSVYLSCSIVLVEI